MDEDVTVVMNDNFTPSEVLRYDRLVISPGPGLPSESGVLMPTLEKAWGKIPVLGVCLGMQAIAEFAGFELYNLPSPLHGRQRNIEHYGEGIFQNIDNPTPVGLYHSWAVREASIPNWQSTAFTDDGILMGISHTKLPIHAVQFHPESIMTPQGKHILANFLQVPTLVTQHTI